MSSVVIEAEKLIDELIVPFAPQSHADSAVTQEIAKLRRSASGILSAKLTELTTEEPRTGQGDERA